MSDSPRRATGLLLELIVVFLGVLIALAADSWLEGREETSQELAYIESLSTDMAKAESELRDVIGRTDSLHAELTTFLHAVKSGGSLPDRSPLFGIGVPSIPTGTLDALIQTGDIRIISDPQVRGAVITERSNLSVAQTQYDQYTQLAIDNVRDFAEPSAEHGVGLSTTEFLPPSVVRGSPRLLGHYEVHLLVLLNHSRELLGMLASVEAVQAALSNGPYAR